jgi:hypothetical protein
MFGEREAEENRAHFGVIPAVCEAGPPVVDRPYVGQVAGREISQAPPVRCFAPGST